MREPLAELIRSEDRAHFAQALELLAAVADATIADRVLNDLRVVVQHPSERATHGLRELRLDLLSAPLDKAERASRILELLAFAPRTRERLGAELRALYIDCSGSPFRLESLRGLPHLERVVIYNASAFEAAPQVFVETCDAQGLVSQVTHLTIQHYQRDSLGPSELSAFRRLVTLRASYAPLITLDVACCPDLRHLELAAVRGPLESIVLAHGTRLETLKLSLGCGFRATTLQALKGQCDDPVDIVRALCRLLPAPERLREWTALIEGAPRSDHYRERAEVYRDAQQFALAASDYKNAFLHDPNRPFDDAFRSAGCLEQAHEFEAAENWLRQLAQTPDIEPNDRRQALQRLATLLAGQQRPEEVARICTDLIVLGEVASEGVYACRAAAHRDMRHFPDMLRDQARAAFFSQSGSTERTSELPAGSPPLGTTDARLLASNGALPAATLEWMRAGSKQSLVVVAANLEGNTREQWASVLGGLVIVENGVRLFGHDYAFLAPRVTGDKTLRTSERELDWLLASLAPHDTSLGKARDSVKSVAAVGPLPRASYWRNWSQLERLALFRSTFRKHDPSAFEGCSNLHTLALWECQLSGLNFADVAHAVRLRELHIGRGAVSCEAIRELRELEVLRLFEVELEGDLSTLARLPNLRELSVDVDPSRLPLRLQKVYVAPTRP